MIDNLNNDKKDRKQYYKDYAEKNKDKLNHVHLPGFHETCANEWAFHKYINYHHDW